jgi:hypothetical protein
VVLPIENKRVTMAKSKFGRFIIPEWQGVYKMAKNASIETMV